MKLGIFYTVFNGTELLPGAIDQILPHVEVVLIVRQSISNRGMTISEYDGSCMSRLPINPKFHLLDFTPALHLNTKENERQKHNKAIQYLKGLKCTHYMMSACDHYYKSDEFLKAKIQAINYDVTLTKMYTYFRNPEWQLTPIEDYQMPFIHKMHPDTEISSQEYKGFRTDPSVRVTTRKSIYCFDEKEIMLHHYSMIRQNVGNKFDNAAASIRWTPELISQFKKEYDSYDIKSNPGVTYFKGRKINVVPNYFNIPKFGITSDKTLSGLAT